RQTADADRCHRAGTVGFGDFRNHADCVREIFRLRQHRLQRATRQTAVTDFATTNTTHATGLTNRVRREVVVQHEMILALAFEGVDGLRVTRSTERGHADRLRFTAGEQRRTVRFRQYADFDADTAHGFVVAAVDTRLLIQDAVANDARLQILEQVFDFVSTELGTFASELGDGLIFQFTDTVVAHVFFSDAIGFAERILEAIGQRLHQRGIGGRGLPVPGRLAGFAGQLFDRLDDRLEFLLGEQHGAQHLVFGQLVGFGFNHQYGVFGAGHDHVETAFRQLLV